jgi:YkoY family integral membrane protein
MISSHDLFLILFLAFLEGVLSIDNAVVLAMMARHLPPKLQKRALTFGLGGSVVFRLIALSLATQLMRWTWVKLLGGLYLLYVAISHLIKGSGPGDDAPKARGMSFWKTVLMIEIMDIAFAVDSILAAVALTPKFWLIFIGGMMGVVMIRFAAQGFLKLLKRFPGFEKTAYYLVFLIGVKFCLDWADIPGVEFESPGHVAFSVFWGAMIAAMGTGFIPAGKLKRKRKRS